MAKSEEALQGIQKPEGAMDLIWGCAAIGKIIGRDARQTFHLLATGQLPGKKMGRRWYIERSKLMAAFADDAA